MKRLLILIVAVAILAPSCLYLPNNSSNSDFGSGINHLPPISSEPGFALNQENVQAYFPRQGQQPELALQALYLSANTNLDIAIYSLTHPVIVKAIGDAQKRGVKVRIITDKVQSAGNTQKHAMNDLITIGVPIKIETHAGLMHLKMSIIDSKIATTGSYNYSKGASEKNDEIFVVINEPWFAQVCEQEFERMWGSSQFVNLGLSY